MKDTTDNPYTRHEQIILLLPWYVNATLQEAERNAVEHHLKVCLLCKREVVSLQKLAAAVNQPSHFDSAAQASFQQLKKRLHPPTPTDIEPTAPMVIKPPKSKWYEHLSLPALAMAAALAFVLVLPHKQPSQLAHSPDFRTLSNSELPVNPKHVIKVIFKEQTPNAVIKQLLSSIQGSILHGPDEQAVYQISFDDTLASNDILARIERLRRDPNVLFAEPAYALLTASPAGK